MTVPPTPNGHSHAAVPRTGSRRSPGHAPLDRERVFGAERMLISKTDTSGVLTYASADFADAVGFTPAELIGRPHSILQHPDLPVCISALMWETVQEGQEFLNFAKLLAKDGGYVWVLAQHSPSFDAVGRQVGYHTVRRMPERASVAVIDGIYRELLEIEAAASGPAEATEASLARLRALEAAGGHDYDSFVWEIINRTAREK